MFYAFKEIKLMDINRYLESTCKDFFVQLPGIVAIQSLDSTFALVNHNQARIMGFRSSGEATGLQYHDMKCKASEEHWVFKNHDGQVFSDNSKSQFLGYHQYADGWKLVLGEKSPIFNNNGRVIGLIASSNDVTNSHLIDFSRFIFASASRFIKKGEKKFTYIIQNGAHNYYGLSERQLECLFFLIRGKSDKSIARILGLSPRTVESYVNDMKCKLDCMNREQIIEKAFSEGLISILPQSFFKA